jgi:hypothetical protein
VKLPFRTAAQRHRDRLRRHTEWTPTFLFFPRRAINPSTGRYEQHLVIGRCVRRLVSRDNDGLPPYKWVYVDRTDAVVFKLTRTTPEN